MAGAIHKMAVYLGLVEDEVAYEDGYDSFEEDYAGYEDEEGAGPDSARQSAVPARNGYDADSIEPGRPAPVRQTADLTRITTLHPLLWQDGYAFHAHAITAVKFALWALLVAALPFLLHDRRDRL